MTGLYTANIDSIPLLAITGQAVTSQLGKDPFQCVDIAKIAAPVTKKSWCVRKEKVPEVMRGGVPRGAGRKRGPVLVDLPLDIQNAEIAFSIEEYKPAVISKPEVKGRGLRPRQGTAAGSEGIMIIMGGGVGRSRGIKHA